MHLTACVDRGIGPGARRPDGKARRPGRWRSWAGTYARWVSLFAIVVTGSFVNVGVLGAQVPSGSDGVRDNDTVQVGVGSLVVIPFTNISGNPADDWIGPGIAETVVVDSARVGTLSVIAHSIFDTLASLPGTVVSGVAPEAVVRRVRDLGAAWLLTGGYQRVGEQLRITARVVDVQTGVVTKTATIDGAVAELFALQDQIVAQLDLAGLTGAAAGNAPSQGPGELDPLQGQVLPTRSAPSGVAVSGGGGRDGAVSPEPSATVDDPLGPSGVTGGITVGDVPDPAAGFARSAGVLTGRPTVQVPPASDTPRIDGRLDDPVWRSAVRITEFVQQRPLDGAPASEQTEVYVAYDSGNLYFGLYAHYSSAGLVRANRVDRDQTTLDDTITLYFDPFLDQQRAFVFSVNGYGVQGDAIVNRRDRGSTAGRGRRRRRGRGGGPSNQATGSVAPTGDPSWDALFDSGGTLVEDGWTAEIAIPFKSLRYPRRGQGEAHRWGFQIVRTIESKDESDVWAPISRDVAGFLPQMGVLEGMTGLSLSRNLEVMPTFLGIQAGSRDTTTGEFMNMDAEPEGSVNLKYGLTSNLTLDFTYNPDFSQIETDRPPDRGQPAVSPQLPRAPAVLPGRAGDLRYHGTRYVRADTDDRRPAVRCQADGQGRSNVAGTRRGK